MRNNAKNEKGERKNMKTAKRFIILSIALALVFTFSISASATNHKVVKGDSMWKISRAYGVSLQSLINANPQIENPSLIYPNDIIYVPDGKGVTDTASSVLELTNSYRAQNGAKALTLDAELCRVAQAKADDMANNGYFSHTSPTYGSPSNMLTSFGVSYRYMGENIAKGYTDARSVMNGWMNSQGHRENILNASFGKLGVGYNSTAKTWVQIFTD